MAIGRTWCPSWSEQRVLSRLAAQDLIPGQPDGTRDALLRRQEILIERLRKVAMPLVILTGEAKLLGDLVRQICGYGDGANP